jgi:hypothetical protein
LAIHYQQPHRSSVALSVNLRPMYIYQKLKFPTKSDIGIRWFVSGFRRCPTTKWTYRTLGPLSLSWAIFIRSFALSKRTFFVRAALSLSLSKGTFGTILSCHKLQTRMKATLSMKARRTNSDIFDADNYGNVRIELCSRKSRPIFFLNTAMAKKTCYRNRKFPM